MPRDKRLRKSLRRFRKAEARLEQKEQWARIRKFKAQGTLVRSIETTGSTFGEWPGAVGMRPVAISQ
jgi:hypothetical protein